MKINFVQRQACPLCAVNQAKVLMTQAYSEQPIAEYLQRYYDGRVPFDDLQDGRYTLMQCQHCGALYQHEILNAAGMQALYEEWIGVEGSFQRKYTLSLQSRIGYARQCVQIARAVQYPVHEIRVLDFGMGWGMWLMMAKAFGMQAEGLELSHSRIAYAESQGLKIVQPTDIPASTYDFINAEQVFEHVAQPTAVIKNCYQWLKPGGVLRIAVPDGRRTIKSLGQGKWQIGDMPSMPLEHINIFTPHSLQDFAIRNGFTPMQAPLILPSTGFTLRDIKTWAGVFMYDLLTRSGIMSTSTIWFRKH